MSIDDRPAKTWGRATPAYDDSRFKTLVSACRSPEHLARAMAAERSRPAGYETREYRIEILQTRLEEVQ